MSTQAPTVSNQDMAAFLGYSNASPAEVSAFESPIMLNSIGITPFQSLQMTDIGADAASAVAGLTSTPQVSVNVESPLNNDFSSALYGQQLANIDEASLASILSQTQAPFSASSTSFDLGVSANTTQAEINQMASKLGKRKLDDIEGLMPAPTGVPLSKRVSMPASFGVNFGSESLPTSISMQRIASYHPDSTSLDTVDPNMSLASSTLPIGRVQTTSAALTNHPAQNQRKVAHNAIERRYRNNINDRIRDLRESVPALQHIRPKKKTSARDVDSDDSSHVDGVEAATKLNKATILGKSTEYIYYLRRTNDLLKRESMYLQEIVRKLPEGENIIQQLLKKAKEDSTKATASLHMPESALQPRKKRC
ncbi:hypothetical protein LPJ78_005103 [Coemansia sp. RSA 989]|nr:hypothetical protein BX667DRAFT_516741 [Coemansia mojavensis]KAJ1743077.1 hypothetical protein LPJ68_001288 [Coemansia sp. RSA 1086]KAJ1861825.1 hypothetical protein LPJ78_005103 [Coemansia sp. RSA 989]KAJ1869772.1 hypothetical protein LPJ55_005142 [Coemansia sp. RSA 990]KAJ2630490.1 hypothetical protein H4R22_002638 [Coemansia sp. RSA 1290]KAJ2651094.1 hypothetical protein IWW40_001862 [Coemansia sp. RSA 1250]KAJ2668140.1 hypothetical protein IWW42_005419 [Coemansia sp. RSA 1085]